MVQSKHPHYYKASLRQLHLLFSSNSRLWTFYLDPNDQMTALVPKTTETPQLQLWANEEAVRNFIIKSLPMGYAKNQ